MIWNMFFTAAILSGIAASANAVPISGFGDPLSDAALAGGTQEGFDSTVPGSYGSITIGDVTYSGLDAPLTIGPDFNGYFNTTGGQSIFNGFDLVPAMFRFDFLSGVTAFAFNWGAADNIWLLQAFDASDILLDSLAVPAQFELNADEYFGISTGSAIAYALLTDQKNYLTEGDYVFIDRFTTNGVSEVPLPGTLILLLSGLGALGGLRLRVRKAV